jgi:CRP/FNR family transcriptional regulator, cyclic AMP receptor protein
MTTWLEIVAGQPERTFATREVVLAQNEERGELLVLLEGEVEVLRDEVRVARTAEAGAVFGEMAILLGTPCTATVRTLRPSRFAVIAEPKAFLGASAEASLHVAELLARRIDALNRYLIDVKRQYEGHDHLGMVDEVLDALTHRQPRSSPPVARASPDE